MASSGMTLVGRFFVWHMAQASWRHWSRCPAILNSRPLWPVEAVPHWSSGMIKQWHVASDMFACRLPGQWRLVAGSLRSLTCKCRSVQFGKLTDSPAGRAIERVWRLVMPLVSRSSEHDNVPLFGIGRSCWASGFSGCVGPGFLPPFTHHS